jgi:hypothetical protein
VDVSSVHRAGHVNAWVGAQVAFGVGLIRRDLVMLSWGEDWCHSLHPKPPLIRILLDSPGSGGILMTRCLRSNYTRSASSGDRTVRCCRSRETYHRWTEWTT